MLMGIGLRKMPVATRVPRRLSMLTPSSSTGASPPTASITLSTPLPDVSSRTLSTAFSSRAFIAAVAPNRSAAFVWNRWVPVTYTSLAPAIKAPCTANSPMLPAPRMATESSLETSALLIACSATAIQSKVAASSKDTLFGNLKHFSSGTTQYSERPPMW